MKAGDILFPDQTRPSCRPPSALFAPGRMRVVTTTGAFGTRAHPPSRTLARARASRTPRLVPRAPRAKRRPPLRARPRPVFFSLPTRLAGDVGFPSSTPRGEATNPWRASSRARPRRRLTASSPGAGRASARAGTRTPRVPRRAFARRARRPRSRTRPPRGRAPTRHPRGECRGRREVRGGGVGVGVVRRRRRRRPRWGRCPLSATSSRSPSA